MTIRLIHEGNSWLVLLDDHIVFESDNYQDAKAYYDKILKGEVL